MGRNRFSSTLPTGPVRPKDQRVVFESEDMYRREPQPGEAAINLFMVIPKFAPQQPDEEDFDEKLNMVRDGSRVWVRKTPGIPNMLSMSARNKAHMEKGVSAVVSLLSKEDVGIAADYPFHLVQDPITGRKQWQLAYPLSKVIKLPSGAPTETWRAVMDPLVMQDLPNENQSVLDKHFKEYAAQFKRYFSQVASRLLAVPDEMRMRIYMGSLLQYQRKRDLNYESFDAYVVNVGQVMRRGNFFFDKELGDGDLATKIRRGIEACPKDFLPASHRHSSLVETPTENYVVVFAQGLRLEMTLQEYTPQGAGSHSQRRFLLAKPSIFKREHKNRGVAIVSANPGGYYDWDLEIMVEEPERCPAILARINEKISIRIGQGGVFIPIIEKHDANAAAVTEMATKSARTYMMHDSWKPYHVEVAVYTDWDIKTRAQRKRSCGMSLFLPDWVDYLERRNIATNPRDFGPDNSALLPVGYQQPEEQGAERLMQSLDMLQKLLDRVRNGEFDKDDVKEDEIWGVGGSGGSKDTGEDRGDTKAKEVHKDQKYEDVLKNNKKTKGKNGSKFNKKSEKK